jgi:hypothetical protein
MSRLGRALIILSIALTGADVHVPGAQAQESPEAGLVKLNRALLESQILRREARLFEETALSQFLAIPPGGVVETKAQAVAGLSAFNAAGVSITDERAIVHDHTAVVIARVQIDGEVRPVGRLGPMRNMAVFVRTDGRWRLLARSATPCLDIAIARGRC